MTKKIRILLPNSMGQKNADAGAAELEALFALKLGPHVAVSVEPAKDYSSLWRELSSGSADLGWGPPFVCARMELQSGRALVQAIRHGAASYRAALVCRKGEAPQGDAYEKMHAIWADRDSTSGYLLPRAWFFSQGMDPDESLARVKFGGSFRACIDALLSGDADISAVFATAEGSLSPRTALDDLDDDEKSKLEIFAYTEESPTDAIVVGPDFDPELALQISNVFVGAREIPEDAEKLNSVFDTPEFVAAAPRAYRALHQIVLQGVKLA